MQPWSTQRGDGSWFHVEHVHEQEELPFLGGATSKEAERAWLQLQWQLMVEAKKPDTAAMMRREKLYQGFHYRDPLDNREKEITNYIFSTIETIWSTMVEQRPRPRMRPRANATPDKALKARDADQFADLNMDLGNFDDANELCQRNKFKFGVNVWLVLPDKNGMGAARPVSPFHFWVDPAAVDLATARIVALGGPVATDHLKALFGDAAKDVKSDNYVGPEYAVTHEIYSRFFAQEMYEMRNDFPGKHVVKDGDPPANTTTEYWLANPGGPRHTGRPTTWTVTFFVRDESQLLNVGEGYVEMPHPSIDGEFVKQYGQYEDKKAPTCPSGWRIVTVTACGKWLQNEPLDECYDGLPIVVGRRYPGTERFWSSSEVDHIASLNQFINRRKDLLNGALEYQSTPAWVSTPGTGETWKRKYIDKGDVIVLGRGGDLKPLEIRGPQSEQFAMLSVEQRDVDTVSGVHDVQQGQRPAGIEAMGAIRSLQEAAAIRQRGHLPAYLRELSQVLHKMLCVTAAKMKGPYRFYAMDGGEVSVDLDTFTSDYLVKFDLGTALATFRQAQEDRMLAYAQAGLIDRQAFFEETAFPGWQAIEQRMQAKELMQMQVEAEAKAKQRPPGGGEKGEGGGE